MPRKPKIAGGTKNKMVEVATDLFIKNGFDGTSVRSIVQGVGCEIGLFYYYYKNKDEIFSDVLDQIFIPYEEMFQKAVDEAREKPEGSLYRFFDYLKLCVVHFRELYDKNMHRTVRWAVREHTLTVMEPYIEEIIYILMEKGYHPVMEPKLTAIFLSHGVGSVILHEEICVVSDITNELWKTIDLVINQPQKKED